MRFDNGKSTANQMTSEIIRSSCLWLGIRWIESISCSRPARFIRKISFAHSFAFGFAKRMARARKAASRSGIRECSDNLPAWRERNPSIRSSELVGSARRRITHCPNQPRMCGGIALLAATTCAISLSESAASRGFMGVAYISSSFPSAIRRRFVPATEMARKYLGNSPVAVRNENVARMRSPPRPTPAAACAIVIIKAPIVAVR